MNKLMIGCVGASLMLAAGAATAATTKPWVAEQARIPLNNGAAMEVISLVKNGPVSRTVACRDTADVLATFRPEAVAFDVTHNRKGKPVEQEDVAGVETFTPVAFQNCQVTAGNHIQADVNHTLGWTPRT